MVNQFKEFPLPTINGEPVLEYYYLAGAPQSPKPKRPKLLA